MSRIDYSKWNKLDYSSSSEDDENEKRLERERVTADAYGVTDYLSLLKVSSSSPLWNGLVTHHRDIFISHVLPKLNETDRYFFSTANTESFDLLEYAGANVSRMPDSIIYECSSISTLEWCWNKLMWVENVKAGAMDQAWFCYGVAGTNKLELLKWVREEKKCEWDEKTIMLAAKQGNLEMLEYCFSNNCPCDVYESCVQAAEGGCLDCVRFLFDKAEPSQNTLEMSATQAVNHGHLNILKYFVEEKKIRGMVKATCLMQSSIYGQSDCLKYLVEEAKMPLLDWAFIACARIYEQHECLNYLREKGCPEPTDEQFARFVVCERQRPKSKLPGSSLLE